MRNIPAKEKVGGARAKVPRQRSLEDFNTEKTIVAGLGHGG